ncbi:MAG: hypothetical protein M3Q07_07765, partial [Pseudobdellovibrionaceae bacterium]|nr:hypothetical protein [Pseudobdellovibrionaceae bacterium]
YRLLSRGWKAHVLPNDFVYHRGETSFGIDALKPHVGIFYQRWNTEHEAALLVESQADSLAWFRDAATNDVAKDQLKSLKQFARERFRQRLKNAKGATTATVALSLYALTEFFDEVCMALIDLKQSHTEVLAVAEGEMPMIRRLPVKTFVLSQLHHPELSAYLADAERYGQVRYLQDYRNSSDKFRATFHQLAKSRDSLEALPIGGQLECSIHERVLVVAPDYAVSGGIFVIAEFIAALKKNGMQVVVATPRGARHPPNHNYGAELYSLEYLTHKNGQPFALMVVTCWESLFWASRIPAERFLWLAQSIEEYFVDPERLSERLRIIAPYLVRGVQVISVSHWIQTVLSVRFGINSTLIENQLSPLVDWSQYPRVRDWESIREPEDASVVVEGSCAKFKNLEEAIDIVEHLGFVRKTLIFAGSLEDRNFLENRDLSGWTVLNNIDREDVLKRFSEADILVRTSALDSFGFAPLEMMATGGLVMIKPYQGAPGHCMNGYNALFFSDASDLRSHFARQKESGSSYFKKIAENGLSFAEARIGVAQEAYVKAVRDILQTVTDPMLAAALQLLCSWRNVGMNAWPQLESAIGRAHNIGAGVVDQVSTKGQRVNMAPLRYRLVDAIVLKGIKRLIPVELYKSLKIVLEKL